MADLVTGLTNLFTGAQPTGSETCLLDLDTLTQLLVVIGALNWGSIAICLDDGDLVEILANTLSPNDSARAQEIQRIIYGLVGVAGVYQLFNLLLPFFPEGTTIANPCILIGSA